MNKGSTITWKWPTDLAIDVHDVKLKSGPAGVRRFQSEPASTGYRYRRTLKKPGRYEIVCTLHEEMTMTIRVQTRLTRSVRGLTYGRASVAVMSLCPSCGSSLLQPLRLATGDRRRDDGRPALPGVLHVDAGVLHPR